LIVVAIGFFFAWVFYCKKPGTAGALALKVKPLYSLVENKFWVDEVYGFFVTGLLMFTRMILAGLVETGLVSGSGALAGATTRGLSTLTRRVQSGNIRSYAGWLALGAAAVLVVMIFGRSLWVH
jgi:NADH-quinone oxidoreductase subunit L